VSTPPRRPACSARALPQATHVVFPAGPSRQAAALRLFQPAAYGGPLGEHCSRAPDFGLTLCGDLKSLFNCFKFQKLFQTSKIRRNL
jgi:hypothetical protein